VANPKPDAGTQSIWHLIHTGGLTVETRSKTVPGRPALQTLLQLDGDQLLCVDLSAMAGLTHWERLRLAAEHRSKLRAQIDALKTPALAVISWLRYLSWTGAAGLAAFSLHDTLISHLSIHSLEPALEGLVFWALPLGLPWLLRQRNGAFHRAFHTEQRAVSQAIYEKLKAKSIVL
jgi:hypothetical protein